MSQPRGFTEIRRKALALSEDPELWEAIRNGNTGVRDMMIEAHMHLIEAMAVTLSKGLPEHITVDDLKSYGALGLLRAVDTYDAEKSTFATHATIAIRGKILDELRTQDWAPKSLRRKARDMDKAIAYLRRTLSREPTDVEVAQQLEIPVEQIGNVRLAVRHATHKSFEDMHPHMQVHHVDDVSKDDGPMESTFINLCRNALADWYWSLAIEEQVVMALYYYRDYNLSQIARETGISEAKVISTHTRLITEFRTRLLTLLDKEGIGLDAGSSSSSLV